MNQSKDVMNLQVHTETIQEFLPQTEELLKSFCSHQLARAKERKRQHLDELEYDNFAGAIPRAKARSVVELMEDRVELPELVLYLASWWFDKRGCSAAPFVDAGMHRVLSLAAQELWEKDRDLALDAMGYLAKAVPEFGAVWDVARMRNVVSLEPLRSLEELTEHLDICRKLDEQIAASIAGHQWVRAKELSEDLQRLQPGCGAHVAVLSNLTRAALAILDRVWNAAQAGFVYDEHLPWGDSFPYVRSRNIGVGVTPASSMERVQAELLQLKDVPDPVRASLESLVLSETERLFIDLFIYPGSISPDTARSFEQNVLQTGELPSPADLIARYPQEAPLLFVLMEERDQAERLWKAAQQDRQLDGQYAHSLGLLALGSAVSSAYQNAQTVIQNWRRVMAQWSIAFSDKAYWFTWGRERSKCYGRDFVYTTILGLPPRLQDYLVGILARERAHAVEQGQTEMAAVFEHLRQDLVIEFAAVRLMQNLGDIPLETGRRVRFGPSGMIELGMQEALMSYFATVQPVTIQSNPALGGLTPVEALQRLRWLFSELRYAAAQMDDDPKRALESLQPSADEPTCGHADCPRHMTPEFPVRVPCAYAVHFVDDNPAYGGMADRLSVVREDALELAVQTHLRFLYHQTDSGGGVALEIFQNTWQTLLKLVGLSSNPEALSKRLRAFLMDISTSAQAADMRVSPVIALLEVSLTQPTADSGSKKWLGPDEPAIKSRLASMLVSRALARVELDTLAAESDLSRALALCPYNHEIRNRLATLWCNLSSSVLYSDRYAGLDYLRRAEELVSKGQAEYPGFNYEGLLKWIQEMRARLTRTESSSMPFPPLPEDENQEPAESGTFLQETNLPEHVKLYGQGTQELVSGKIEAALQTFDKALKLAPEDKEIQANTAETVLALAVQRVEHGRQSEGLALIDEWKPRLPTKAAQLERQAEFLSGWPVLRDWLKKIPDCVYEVREYQRVLLPFQSENAPSIVVTCQMDKEDLCLLAPLPILAVTDAEIALHNLLVATREVPGFKASCTREWDLRLQGQVPLQVLDAAWLYLLVYELSHLADVTRAHLLALDQLRDWFREARQRFAQLIATHEYLAASGKAFERLCQNQDQPYERLTDARYNISTRFGQVVMEAWTDGVRLSLPIRELPAPPNRLKMLRQMAMLNTRLRWCKLTLTDSEQITLNLELPFLEPESAARAFELLERQVELVRSELT